MRQLLFRVTRGLRIGDMYVSSRRYTAAVFADTSVSETCTAALVLLIGTLVAREGRFIKRVTLKGPRVCLHSTVTLFIWIP
jgi:hypothetical protein